MDKITIKDLIDLANGYCSGMVVYKLTPDSDEVTASVIFNEAKGRGSKIIFSQINQDGVEVTLNKEDVVSIEDRSRDGSIFYAITLKSGTVVNVFLFHEKSEDAKACYELYGTYDDFLKELNLYDLEEMVEKTKTAFVTVSDSSSHMKQTYTNVRLEEMDEEEMTRKLVFFNEDKGENPDRLEFTLCESIENDIWLMRSSEEWDGLQLRLYGQPFTKVKISLLYK